MSIAESVDVRITGDASGATLAMGQAGEAVSGAVGTMAARLSELGLVAREKFAALGEASAQAAERVTLSGEKIKLATEAMHGGFEKLGGVVGKLNAVMLGFTAALAGGEIFEKSIEKTNELTAENLKLSKTLGISLKEASGLHAALSKFGILSDTATTAAQKLARQLSAGEDKFKTLGIETRDAAGHLRNELDVMLDSLDVLRNQETGFQRNIVAQKLFGRGAGDVTALLKLNREELEEGAKTAEKLGLVTTQDGVNAMKAYKVAVNETKEVFEGITVAIGNAVLPTLTMLGEWLKDNGPAAIEAMKRALEVLGVVFSAIGSVIKGLWDIAAAAFDAIGEIIIAVFGKTAAKQFGDFQLWLDILKALVAGFKAVCVIAFDIIAGVVIHLVDEFRLFGAVARDVFTMNWSSIGADWKAGMDRIAQNAQATAAKIKAAFAEAMAPDAVKTKKNTPDAKGGTGQLGEELIKQPKGAKEKKAKAEQSRIGEFDQQLAALKLSLDQQNDAENTFHEFSKAEEAKYWQDILARTDLSAKERQEVTRKYLDASLADKKANFQAGIAAEQAEIADARTSGDRRIEIAKTIARQIAAAYGTGTKEAIAAEKEVTRIVNEEAKKQARLAVDAAKAREAAELDVVSAEDAAAKHRTDMGLQTQRELIQQEQQFAAQKHQIQLAAIADQIAAAKLAPDSVEQVRKLNEQRLALERQYQAQLAQLRDQAELQSSLRLRTGIASVSASWGTALAKMATLQAGFASTINSLWQGLVGSITTALSNMIEQYIAKWLASLLIKKAAGAASNVATVTSEAAVAGAGGIASMAAAPFPLNLGAPAFGAAMSAAALAFAPVASAAGGWDVPASIGRGLDGRGGQMAMIHPKEMVLPADLADKVRGGSAGGGDTHIHVHATDAQSVKRLFMDNKAELAAAIKSAMRDGVR